MPKKSEKDSQKDLIVLKRDAEFLLSCLEPFKEGFVSGYSWGRLPRENLKKIITLYNDILGKAKKLQKSEKTIQKLEKVDPDDFNEFDLLINVAMLNNHIVVE
ncbi:MAG: hypothetical protein KAS67_03470 [Thermoplasmata archaeon]|nr:hypothetical protein [Thermoplasmata archaeon]